MMSRKDAAMAERPTLAGIPPWTMGVASMFLIQLCNALSTGLIASVGPAGTAWLRLAFGAIVFVLIARPPLRLIRPGDVPALLGLGIATGAMVAGLLAAMARIPLGTAVAIEFLGPLTVAAVRSRSRRMLVWPLLAFGGVTLLTEPWKGGIDPWGILFAVVAGTGWGAYIILTQHVGDRFSGISGLSITFPIAAVVVAFVGVPQVVGNLTWPTLLLAAVLALMSPVIPFGLEMLALRRMTHTAFGTLMALEPAIGVLLGLVLLHQVPTWIQVIGIVLVVAAGAGAQRGGIRRPASSAVTAGLDVPHE
jgi:inner membrane transporter RhtA